MPTQIVATYTATTYFDVPEGVYLLPQEDLVSSRMTAVGYWWIKWDVLHYIDNDLIEQTIEGQEDEGNRKRPDSIEVNQK